MIARKAYYIRTVLKTRRFSGERLERFQSRLLRERAREAYDFGVYRSRWDEAEVSPDDIRSVDDLDEIPVIGGEDVRDGIGSMRTALTGSSGSLQTSGSSGNDRLVVDYDGQAWDWVEAVYLRSLLVNGYRFRGTQSYYWEDEFDDGFLRELVVPKRRIPSDASYREQLEMMEEQDAQFLLYYPQVLFTAAKLALRSDRDYDIGPRAIFTHGEILTPAMRDTIEAAFDAPVRDFYAAAEFDRIARECPDGEGYHVEADTVLAEVLDDGEPVAPGESGTLVGTNLVNRATPIIRYDIGDVVMKGEKTCSCPDAGPVLEDVRGRIGNTVVADDGSSVRPDEIVEALARSEDLLRFRFVQEGGERTVRYVPNRGFSRDAIDAAQERLRALGLGAVPFEEAAVERNVGGKLPPVEVRD